MDLAYYDAQTAVLGSLLLDPGRLAGQIFHRVSPDDFYDPVKRNLFSAAREIFFEQSPLDPVTLVERAGSAYGQAVAEIMRATPTASNWEEYVRLLKDGAALERMRRLGDRLGEISSAEDGRKLLAEAQQLLSTRPGRRCQSYQEMIGSFLDRMGDPTPPDYLDFGLDALNKRIKLGRGRFVVLGADSSVGKTAFALQLAYGVARSGKRVGFCSYETSIEDAADRTIANTTGAELADIKGKRIGRRTIELAMSEGKAAAKIPLYVLETAGCTVDELRAEVLCRQLDVVFVDYVQLIPGARNRSRFEVVTDTSMQLHTMAQQLGVTVIALSQVTPPDVDKDGKRRRLRKDDLRESRQLINDADCILMMDLDNPKDPKSDRILIVDKNKDGPLGRLRLTFDPAHMRFTPADAAKKEQTHQVKFEELPVADDDDLPF